MDELEWQKIFEKYVELGTLKETSHYFNISPETIRKYFIKNNIPYNKKIVYSYDPNFFNIDTETSFYWAGFIAADGNISNKGDFTLSLKVEDRHHIEKFAAHTMSSAPITILGPTLKMIDGVETRTSGTTLIRFRAKHWITGLQNFNIVPNKTAQYELPNNVINHKLFKHFVRGYFDGDGWYGKTQLNNKLRVCFGICGNFSVIENIKHFLQNTCKLDSNPIIYPQKNIFKLAFHKQNDVFKISKYLYYQANVFLDRKYELAKKSEECNNDTIILNIDKNILEEAYNRLRSYSIVAQELKCSKSSIANYIRKYNLLQNTHMVK